MAKNIRVIVLLAVAAAVLAVWAFDRVTNPDAEVVVTRGGFAERAERIPGITVVEIASAAKGAADEWQRVIDALPTA